MTNIEAVKEALTMLASAWRGDWNDFDGRTLRHQLEEVVKLFDDPDPEAGYKRFLVEHGICPQVRCWSRWCAEQRGDSCSHLRALEEAE